jgi:hypothetical protein
MPQRILPCCLSSPPSPLPPPAPRPAAVPAMGPTEGRLTPAPHRTLPQRLPEASRPRRCGAPVRPLWARLGGGWSPSAPWQLPLQHTARSASPVPSRPPPPSSGTRPRPAPPLWRPVCRTFGALAWVPGALRHPLNRHFFAPPESKPGRITLLQQGSTPHSFHRLSSSFPTSSPHLASPLMTKPTLAPRGLVGLAVGDRVPQRCPFAYPSVRFSLLFAQRWSQGWRGSWPFKRDTLEAAKPSGPSPPLRWPACAGRRPGFFYWTQVCHRRFTADPPHHTAVGPPEPGPDCPAPPPPLAPCPAMHSRPPPCKPRPPKCAAGISTLPGT